METLPTKTPEYDPGSAIAALTPQQQRFVEAYVGGGTGPSAVDAAMRAAGYSTEANYGYQLMKKPRVLAAIREEAAKHLLSGALLGAKVLSEIAMDSQHKDRLKAAKELLAHSGFISTTEQRITVEHVGSEARELVKELQVFAKATGLNAQQLLGSIGVAVPVDAEFEEVWGV
ncbi:MAG: terminase small subunit [Terriglobales bacterium]